MEVLSCSTKDTKELAGTIAKKLKKGDTLALYGELGSGKTTFVRYLVEALGIGSRVQSPTFVLHRKYGFINHLDLYRLKSVVEAKNLGIEDILHDKDFVTIIEWPKLIEELFSDRTICINFEHIGENERKITIHNFN